MWMNIERMKNAIKHQELLGLEPYYVLKNILERQQLHGWSILILLLFHLFELLFFFL